MIKFIDNWLNRVTMYRLVLYYLIFLLGAAVVLSTAFFNQFFDRSVLGGKLGVCPNIQGCRQRRISLYIRTHPGFNHQPHQII